MGIPNYTTPATEDPPEWLIRNVTQWLPLVHRWHAEFPELDPAIILGLIAQESQGFPYVVAEDLWGSTGLMQVGPRSWTGTRTQLLNPAFNIFVGMRMLTASLEKSDGDIRRALGAYNCGFIGLDAGRCGRHGGYKYADRILNYWAPIFRATLWTRAGEDDFIGDWLKDLGYEDRLGHWEPEEEEETLECKRVLPKRRFRPRICLD